MYNWCVELEDGFVVLGEEPTEAEAKKAAYRNADIGSFIKINDPDGIAVYELKI